MIIHRQWPSKWATRSITREDSSNPSHRQSLSPHSGITRIQHRSSRSRMEYGRRRAGSRIAAFFGAAAAAARSVQPSTIVNDQLIVFRRSATARLTAATFRRSSRQTIRSRRAAAGMRLMRLRVTGRLRSESRLGRKRRRRLLLLMRQNSINLLHLSDPNWGHRQLLLLQRSRQ